MYSVESSIPSNDKHVWGCKWQRRKIWLKMSWVLKNTNQMFDNTVASITCNSWIIEYK